MKKLFAMLATVCTLALPTAMQAAEGFYVGGQGGVNFLDVNAHHSHLKTDVGYNLGIVGGYKWCNGISAEAEITYRRNDVRHISGDIHTWSYMVNGYYDLPVCWCVPVTPYLGAGIGYDRTELKIHRFGRGHSDEFAWQLMAGLNYEFCNNVVVNAEYKFHDINAKHVDVYDHSITIGAKKFF